MEKTNKMEETKETQESLQRKREQALQRLRKERTEEALWDCVTAYQDFEFHTYSGLPYSYHMKYGRSGTYTKELWINRREKSKSPSGVHIRKYWNYSRRAKDRLSSARKRWAISVESRIFTASFTSLPCWKCRKKQKKKLLCRQQDKNRRENKFFAHAGLDNHALGDII